MASGRSLGHGLKGAFDSRTPCRHRSIDRFPVIFAGSPVIFAGSPVIFAGVSGKLPRLSEKEKPETGEGAIGGG